MDSCQVGQAVTLDNRANTKAVRDLRLAYSHVRDGFALSTERAFSALTTYPCALLSVSVHSLPLKCRHDTLTRKLHEKRDRDTA